MSLNILILSDAKPGHFNQSEGVVSALKKICNVEVEYLSIKKNTILPTKFLRWFITTPVCRALSTTALFGITNIQFRKLVDAQYNLIVSTGGETLVQNILLSRLLNISNIYSGSVRGISSDNFSAILHIDPTLENVKNYIVGLKPSPVERLERPLRPVTDRRYSLLVGGPTRYQPSTLDHWQHVANALSASSKSWTIVTSRRTPNDVAELLINLASSNANFTLHDYRETGSGVAAQVIQDCDGIVVSEDSTSMISEGIAAGLPVVSLSVDGGSKSSDEAYINLMRSRNWYRPIDMSAATHASILTEFELCTPTAESHLDILADRLFDQIPELRNFSR